MLFKDARGTDRKASMGSMKPTIVKRNSSNPSIIQLKFDIMYISLQFEINQFPSLKKAWNPSIENTNDVLGRRLQSS